MQDMFRPLSATIGRFETVGDVRRSFTIDSTTMHLYCEDGSEYNTPCWWCVGQDFVPLTKAEQESMDHLRIEAVFFEGRRLRLEVPVNDKMVWVYFTRFI